MSGSGADETKAAAEVIVENTRISKLSPISAPEASSTPSAGGEIYR